MLGTMHILIVTASLGVLFSGCATTELQTQAKLTRTVTIDHSKNESKTVYLQVTNTAGGGGENMELNNSLKENLKTKGYTIVPSSADAEYGLFVNVLFANNLKEANAIKAALSAGIMAGTTSAIAGGSGGDSLLVGAAVALGAGIVGSAFEDEVFRAVVDISIRDYVNEGVRTIRTQNDSGAEIHNVTRAGNINGLAGNLGSKDGASDMKSGVTESVTTETIKDFEEYKTRAFVEAIRVDLKLDEAMPIMEAKITRQIGNLF